MSCTTFTYNKAKFSKLKIEHRSLLYNLHRYEENDGVI